MNNKLKNWHFGIDNDKLVELVLSGKKTATTYIYDGDTDDVGTESILIYENGKKACITKTKQVIIDQFKNISWNIAKLEGENNSLEDWKKTHNDYFKTVDNSFNDGTMVAIEIFEVVRI